MKAKSKLIIILFSTMLILGLILYMGAIWNSEIVIVSIADSQQVNQKLKTALTGGKTIDLTESEVNNILQSYFFNGGKSNGRIRDGYVKIANGQIQVSAVMSIYNHDFFIKSSIKPEMKNGQIYMIVEKVSVGKIEVPKSIYTYFMKKYLSSDVKVVDNSIDFGDKIFIFDVQNLCIEGNNLKIVLKQSNAQANNNTDTNVKSSQNNNMANSQSKSDQLQPKVDPRAAALEKTNSQLNNVLQDVKSSDAKKWVKDVIFVNAKMIDNPDGDYTSDINKSKAAYQKLPEYERKEIKNAAMDNLDMASVKLLVNSYGMQ